MHTDSPAQKRLGDSFYEQRMVRDQLIYNLRIGVSGAHVSARIRVRSAIGT
jgi:hypothetical protein